MTGLSDLAWVRAGGFFLVWGLVWLPIAIPVAIAVRWRPGQPITPGQKLPLIGTLYLLAPVLLGVLARLLGESLQDYGLMLNGALGRSLGLGLLIGVAGLALLYGLEWSLGWIRWRGLDALETAKEAPNRPGWRPVVETLGTTLGLGLWVGFTEELVFRGFLLHTLELGYGAWVAVAIASLVFALLHLVWELRETLPQLPGLVLMGLVLAIAFWADGQSIGLPWGLHAGWIWAIASVDTLQVFKVTGKVPAWLTGWQQQLLAGAMGNGFLLLMGLGLWLVARQNAF